MPDSPNGGRAVLQHPYRAASKPLANGSALPGARQAPAQAAPGTDRRRVTIDPVALTKRTALLLPSDLPVEHWHKIGQQLHLITESSAWWLGDWLIYGLEKYPGRYKEAIAKTSLDYQTLRNYAWIARKFPVHRRREGLCFQHHVAVAALPAAEQDIWLERAERGRWPVSELRKRLRALRPRTDGGSAPSHSRIELKIGQERTALWEKAASRASTDLVAWAVSVLDAAARDALEELSE
jgi:hypothetical protein